MVLSDFEADQHDDFVRRNNLHELRVALNLCDGQFQRNDVRPRVLQTGHADLRDPADELQFDLRQRSARDVDLRVPSASHQPIQINGGNIQAVLGFHSADLSGPLTIGTGTVDRIAFDATSRTTSALFWASRSAWSSGVS